MVELMFTTFISACKMSFKCRPRFSKGASRINITTGPSEPEVVADKCNIL